MQAVSVLLGANIYADNGGNGHQHNHQVNRESDHCLDGVPSTYEAALQVYYRGDQPICPFCGQRYRKLEAEGYTLGEIIIVTLWRCKCGVFPVKAEVLQD
jgi:hypothetical protein